ADLAEMKREIVTAKSIDSPQSRWRIARPRYLSIKLTSMHLVTVAVCVLVAASSAQESDRALFRLHTANAILGPATLERFGDDWSITLGASASTRTPGTDFVSFRRLDR